MEKLEVPLLNAKVRTRIGDIVQKYSAVDSELDSAFGIFSTTKHAI